MHYKKVGNQIQCRGLSVYAMDFESSVEEMFCININGAFRTDLGGETP